MVVAITVLSSIIFILCVFLKRLQNVISEKNKLIKDLRAKIDFLKEVNSRFEKIEDETKAVKKNISEGTITDNIINSVNILHNIKDCRKNSKN